MAENVKKRPRPPFCRTDPFRLGRGLRRGKTAVAMRKNHRGRLRMEAIFTKQIALVPPDITCAGKIADYRREFLAAGNSTDGTGSLRQAEEAEE